jgi:hypothetical protein
VNISERFRNVSELFRIKLGEKGVDHSGVESVTGGGPNLWTIGPWCTPMLLPPRQTDHRRFGPRLGSS